MSSKHKRRSSHRTLRPAPGTAAGQSYPIWVDACGRRMFVVGYTPGGAPYGILEDQMEAATDDLDTAEDDGPSRLSPALTAARADAGTVPGQRFSVHRGHWHARAGPLA